MPTPLTGQTLGNYRVLDALGRGGMAMVYRAYHPQLDRFVALKVLRSDVIDDESFLARFRREAQAIAALRHPHIVQVFDFDVQDDVHGLGITFMVMEMLEGDTLKARLNDYRVRNEPMPLGEIIRLMLDVLDGLAYAHSEGMIHRDIKPANIMLTKRGQAVITDFGIAQIVGGTQHTASGMLMGTLNYMAPEQGLEAKSDIRSDIYSLGIVFYELLTQQTPFDADTPLAILMKHLNDPLPLPREIWASIPESLEAVLLKALSKEPDDRYQNAAAMAQALHQAAQMAGITVPEQISLPLSFTTPEDPAESVAVFSGSIRQQIQDHDFAFDDTQMTSEQVLLQQAQPAVASSTPLLKRFRLRRRLPAVFQTVMHLVAVVAHRVHLTSGATLDRYLKQYLRLPIVPLVLIPFNLLLLLFAGITNAWDLYEKGWPAQLLLGSLLFFALMVKHDKIALLIPGGLLAGNGLLLAYYSLTDNWDAWDTLWPLEPLLILTVLGFVIYAKKEVKQVGYAREMGYRLAKNSIIAAGFILLLSIPF